MQGWKALTSRVNKAGDWRTCFLCDVFVCSGVLSQSPLTKINFLRRSLHYFQFLVSRTQTSPPHKSEAAKIATCLASSLTKEKQNFSSPIMMISNATSLCEKKLNTMASCWPWLYQHSTAVGIDGCRNKRPQATSPFQKKVGIISNFSLETPTKQVHT